MFDAVVELIVDESKWPSLSLGAGFVAVLLLLVGRRGAGDPERRLVLAAMNLFFGVFIGAMACGHLLAVTTKLALGTLAGPVGLFYLIGGVLAVPAALVTLHSRRILDGGDRRRRTLLLNAWLAATLVALGPHNLPLAAPGLLNIAYQASSGRSVGRVIAGIAVVFTVGLFVASLVFLASGQSFEQFQSMR